MADPRRIVLVRILVPFMLVEAVLVITGLLVLTGEFGRALPRLLGYGLVAAGALVAFLGVMRMGRAARALDARATVGDARFMDGRRN